MEPLCPPPTTANAMDASNFLSIVERADLSTISALLQTNKSIHALIASYEHSIVKAKLAMFPTLHPSGSVLSSDPDRRLALPPYSFEVIQELEARSRRHDDILRGCETPCQTSSSNDRIGGGYGLCLAEGEILSPGQQKRLLDGIHGALWCCDGLADCVAEFYTCNGGSVFTRRKLFTSTPEETNERQVDVYLNPNEDDMDNIMFETHQLHPDDSDEEQQQLLTPPDSPAERFSPLEVSEDYLLFLASQTRQIRLNQLRHLASFRPLQLAFLCHLTDAVGRLYALHYAHDLSSDPGGADKIVAFKEGLLRQGSLLLWAHVRISGEPAQESLLRGVVGSEERRALMIFTARTILAAVGDIRK